MDVTPLIPSDRKVISGYGPGMFRINNQPVSGPVIIEPHRQQAWSVGTFQDFSVESRSFLGEGAEPYEVLLIGTGNRMQFMKPSVRQAIRQLGPVADVMDTGAACRTYNVLLSEGRRVAAALLPVS